MLKKTHKNKYATITIILAALLVVLMALGAWYVINSTQSQDTPQNVQQQSSQEPQEEGQNSEEVEYVNLEDWGVAFEQPETLEITFYKGSDSGIDSYEFSTKAVEALGGQCIATSDHSAMSIASIVRETSAEGERLNSIEVNNGEPINGYYYYIYGSHSLCSEEGGDIQTADREQLIEALRQLQAVN